jgi:predicted hydrocarbon binding protein
VSDPAEREATAKAVRVFLLGIEDVLGKAGVATALRAANVPQYLNNYPPPTMDRTGHPARHITQITRAVHDIYGARGARAIMQRVGRAQAKSGIAEMSRLINATKFALKLVPHRQQVRLALEMEARAVNEQVGDQIEIAEDKDYFYHQAHQCCYCIDWHGESSPVCHTAVGFLQGLLAAMIEGVEFRVDETLCRARGDALCRYRIALITDKPAEPNEH